MAHHNHPAVHTPLSEKMADEFFRGWLNLIDSGAPVASFYKYLVDGKFAEWSYPGGVAIADRPALEAYFKATWGSLREQHSHIESLDITDPGDGTFLIQSRVHWTATMQDDKPISLQLKYTITLGSGRSSGDPEGHYPKVQRYKVERLLVY